MKITRWNTTNLLLDLRYRAADAYTAAVRAGLDRSAAWREVLFAMSRGDAERAGREARRAVHAARLDERMTARATALLAARARIVDELNAAEREEIA